VFARGLVRITKREPRDRSVHGFASLAMARNECVRLQISQFTPCYGGAFLLVAYLLQTSEIRFAANRHVFTVFGGASDLPPTR